ncbi:MAG: gamma-glutamyltransferase [Elainellaceae cyanobacterium]
MRDFQLPGRSPVYGNHGAAATSHPLATLTALETLRSGGNAVDAAIAAAALLCVIEPQSTGIGGDCFALYAPAHENRVIAYNGSGRAPAAATVEWFQHQGLKAIAQHSPHAVTIPGAVDGWCRLNADYGRKDLAELLQPAIDYAQTGYPIQPRIAFDWERSVKTLSHDPNARALFLPQGRPPRAGEHHAQPQLANTLKTIAEQGRDGFYQGAIAHDMVSYLQSLGGLHTLDDFATAAGEYVTPISTTYRGFEVVECPPNGQGITVLLMLNILEGIALGDYAPGSAERIHYCAEAARLAYRDRNLYVADPAQASVPIEGLLSKDYAAGLRQSISGDRAFSQLPSPVFPDHPHTVYLCVVDAEGNAISFIQSIFHSFGSGIVTPNTGILLQSRGTGFQLDPDHPNHIAPGKRPFHTIIPGMLKREGQVVMPFGVMGAAYQPAGQMHLLTNLIDYNMGVQTALDFPRFFHQNNVLQLERGIAPEVGDALRALGHQVQVAPEPLGGGQAIWIDRDNNLLIGGSDPRKDGCALAY